jgi:Iap family predicted aminopeptidase
MQIGDHRWKNSTRQVTLLTFTILEHGTFDITILTWINGSVALLPQYVIFLRQQ